MYKVTELNHLEELASIHGIWESLLLRTARASFFQTLDWLEVYWRHFGEGQRLRVLLVERDNCPVGILPLVVRREKTRVGMVRFLTYPLDHWGSFYGPIGPDPLATLSEGLRFLHRSPCDWQVLELRWVDADRLDQGHTTTALLRAGFSSRPARTDCTYLVELERQTFEQYLASRTSKWRNNYKRWERRLGERGEVTYVRHRPGHTGDPRWDLYETCEELARRSWQGDSQDGTTLCSPAIRPFLRDVHTVAARRGSVDMNLLYVGETPVAYAYNYYLQGYVYGLRIGYDAQASRDGVGNVLYLRAIEDSFRRGDHIYDFGPGSFEAKRHLLTQAAGVYRFSHYRCLDLQSQLIRVKRWSDARSQTLPAVQEPQV